MRHILLLLLGIAIGTIAAFSLSSAIGQRNPVPRAVMVMLAYHQGQLQRLARADGCEADTMHAQLQQLDAIASDIPAALPGFDPPFKQAAQQLRQAIQTAQSLSSQRCQEWQAPLAAIKERCDACHRQYR